MINSVTTYPPTNPYQIKTNSTSDSSLGILATGASALTTGYIASRHCLYNLTLDKAEIGAVSRLTPQTSSLLKSGRNSAIWSGLISSAINGYEAATGNIEGTQAAGNVVSDVVGGLGGGIVAAGLASTATKALGATASRFAVGSLGMVVGSLAFVGVDVIYRLTGAKDFIATGTKNFLDKLFKGAVPPQGS